MRLPGERPDNRIHWRLGRPLPLVHRVRDRLGPALTLTALALLLGAALLWSAALAVPAAVLLGYALLRCCRLRETRIEAARVRFRERARLHGRTWQQPLPRYRGVRPRAEAGRCRLLLEHPDPRFSVLLYDTAAQPTCGQEWEDAADIYAELLRRPRLPTAPATRVRAHPGRGSAEPFN